MKTLHEPGLKVSMYLGLFSLDGAVVSFVHASKLMKTYQRKRNDKYNKKKVIGIEYVYIKLICN